MKFIVIFGPPAVGKMSVGEKLLEHHEQYRLNSNGDFFYQDNYLKIDNTDLSAYDVACKIFETFEFTNKQD